MNHKIEQLDKRRMKLLAWYMAGVAVFLILSVTRFFFRQSGLNSQPAGLAVLSGLLLSLAVLALCTMGFAAIGREAKQDPSIQEALQNEWVQSLSVQSWKAAYIGAIATTVFFAVAWFFYPVSDPVLVALTSIIAGAGAYHATFYFKYRSS